jgi:hypothetical protein
MRFDRLALMLCGVLSITIAETAEADPNASSWPSLVA